MSNIDYYFSGEYLLCLYYSLGLYTNAPPAMEVRMNSTNIFFCRIKQSKLHRVFVLNEFM